MSDVDTTKKPAVKDEQIQHLTNKLASMTENRDLQYQMRQQAECETAGHKAANKVLEEALGLERRRVDKLLNEVLSQEAK